MGLVFLLYLHRHQLLPKVYRALLLLAGLGPIRTLAMYYLMAAGLYLVLAGSCFAVLGNWLAGLFALSLATIYLMVAAHARRRPASAPAVGPSPALLRAGLPDLAEWAAAAGTL